MEEIKDTPDRPQATDGRLASLEARIAVAQTKHLGQSGAGKLQEDPNRKFVALGFRIGVELVSAMIVALGIGWALDRALGTRPWLLVVFFFMGAAAGMFNVYRAVSGVGMAALYRLPGDEDGSGSGQS